MAKFPTAILALVSFRNKSTPSLAVSPLIAVLRYVNLQVMVLQDLNTVKSAVCPSVHPLLRELTQISGLGCDNYLPYGDLAPDAECNIPCKANTAELCGAGNRLAVYQDSSAIPISPDKCITGRGFFNFQLQAVPVNSAGGLLVGGVTKQIYAVTLNFNLQDTVQYTILSVSISKFKLVS